MGQLKPRRQWLGAVCVFGFLVLTCNSPQVDSADVSLDP